MKKTIPEQINYFCDTCGKELKGSDKEGNYKVVMSSDGRRSDWQGSWCRYECERNK